VTLSETSIEAYFENISLIVIILGATIGAVPSAATASTRYFWKKTRERLFGKTKQRSEIPPDL
jgi:hypothetical protein